LEDANGLFESYRKGCYHLINHLENLSLNLTGYLSIYHAFTSIKDLWEKPENGCFIRFYERHKIGDKPIQLLFCEYLFKGIDFFSGDYSHLVIFEHSESLKLDIDSFFEIRDYVRTCNEQLLHRLISRIVKKICSRDGIFKSKGDLLSPFLSNLSVF